MTKNRFLFFLVFVLYFGFLLSPAQAAVSIIDNFNRADGPVNGNWTAGEGSFTIVNNAAQGGDYAIATISGISSNIVEADIEATGSGVQYVALVLGYQDVNTNYFIKAQDDDGGTPDFNRLYCYYGNNRHLPIWSDDIFSLSPSFTSAHMRVEYNPNSSDIIITFSRIDGGSGIQQYICPNAPLTGGTGIGIGSYNIARGRIDNFAADLPSVTVPAFTDWGMIAFMAFAGLGAIYRLRKWGKT